MHHSTGPWRSLRRGVDLHADDATSVASRAGSSLASVVVQGATRAGTNFVVGRFLGPAALGAVGTGVATAALLSLLWPASTGVAATKFLARSRADIAEGPEKRELTNAVARHLAGRTMLALAFLSCISVILWALLYDGTLIEGVIIALLTCAYSGYNFTRGVHLGVGAGARFAKIDIITAALGLSGVVISLLVGIKGIWALLPVAVSGATITVICWPRGLTGAVPRTLRREMDAFVFWATLGTLASAGFLQASMLVARLAGGLHEGGQYAAALTLATPMSLVASSLSMALLPAMSQAFGRRDTEAMAKHFESASHHLVVVLVATFGSVVLMSRPLVAFVWGSKYADTSNYLIPLAIAGLLAGTSVPAVNVLIGRATRAMMAASAAAMFGLGVGIISWAILVPRLGTLGVALGYLTGIACLAATAIVLASRVVNVRMTASLLSLGASVAFLLAAGYISTIQEWSALQHIALTLAWLILWGGLHKQTFLTLFGRFKRRR